jgi:septal ring factor EnvC (AmiA/AmiB activator)
MARLALRARLALGSAVAIGAVGLSPLVSAEDRREELEGIREAIQESRDRVSIHESDERALLERLEEVDRRLLEVSQERDRARRAVSQARAKLAEIEPKLETARSRLEETRRALSKRAVALYRAGKVGPLRLLFSADSLAEMFTRAEALRVLVRHDADLVARFEVQQAGLESLRSEAARAMSERAEADRALAQVAKRLASERSAKGELLTGVREDRTSERRLLLELEQAAQALEETIRQLGADSGRGGRDVAGSGIARRRGALLRPVEAPISAGFGKVVDPEFKTSTRRNGIDFEASAGSPVRTVAPGLVRFAGWFRGYGRIVIVDHGDGFHTISGHLDEIHVEVDQKLVEGEPLGTVGETGSLGGPSLYFELRRDGKPVDPEPWLSADRG